MRKGKPRQLIAELNEKITELKGYDITSSNVIMDKDVDVIVADEDISVVDEDQEIAEIDTDDYLSQLYISVEDELNEMTQGVAWTSDDENVYMDVNFVDGSLITFTIPKEDLIYDGNNIRYDVEYICNAVKDTQGFEDSDSEVIDDAIAFDE